jgi:lipoate-protein ligase B
LRDLEEAIIRGLAALGVAAGRRSGLTGVWVADRKIASIGVAVRRWTTYHGAAINVAPDRGFESIRACGLDSAVMTSLEEVTGRPWPREEVVAALVAAVQDALAPARAEESDLRAPRKLRGHAGEGGGA